MSKAERLTETLRSVANRPLVVLITGHPDPDAIGSALAHQRICEHLGVPATIAYVHPISRYENRALVKLLDIEMVRISTGDELRRFEVLSLVDSSFPEPTIVLPRALELISVVDHHRDGRVVEAPFVDIRPGVGSTCAIYASYLEAGIVPFGEQRADARVATALLFGIRTDTDAYLLASADDHLAAAFLRRKADLATLRRVAAYPLSATTLDVLGRAIAGLEIIRDYAVAGVGFVPAGERDAIGHAADMILRREDIDTVLVYGIVDGRIDGSLRTNSASVDPAYFVQAAFGADEHGKPYGGGRADKGGFQIPLGVVGELQDDAALWELVQRLVRNHVARVIPGLAG
jgi:nanoRNase/pAp phosphatase (c-di-AMP/oligoRNAs hydrolase)